MSWHSCGGQRISLEELEVFHRVSFGYPIWVIKLSSKFLYLLSRFMAPSKCCFSLTSHMFNILIHLLFYAFVRIPSLKSPRTD